jgi:general stress protein 26
MTQDDEAGRVWTLMEKIGICMLSTRDGEEIRARPMAAHLVRDEHAIYFLTDAESHKDEEIAKNPHVGVAFSDTGSQTYVALTGRGVVSNDRAKIRELWSTPAKAWWDSPEDPSLRVLKVTPHDAQYWDGPSRPVSLIKMLAAAATDRRPDMGDNAKVDL